jgi:hypothetical protein
MIIIIVHFHVLFKTIIRNKNFEWHVFKNKLDLNHRYWRYVIYGGERLSDEVPEQAPLHAIFINHK